MLGTTDRYESGDYKGLGLIYLVLDCSRKDFITLIKQLGKPTAFLTKRSGPVCYEYSDTNLKQRSRTKT